MVSDKTEKFLQVENFQYGSVLSGEILRKIMLSSMIRDGYLRLIMSYWIVTAYLLRKLRTWRTLVIDYGLRIVMDLLTTISREIVAGLAEWGSAWEDLLSIATEKDLFWLPMLKREASSGTIVRENLLYYFEEFCKEDLVPCKAVNVQEILTVWKIEVTIEWQERSKKFIWFKVKIFRHWWGNKEEIEPNVMMELTNMSHKPIVDNCLIPRC
jgi:hypothetical protein